MERDKVKITARGPDDVTMAFHASELLVIVNALEAAASTADADDEAVCKRVQRPLLDALRYLRPKTHLRDGRWGTDWARGDDGKHV